MNNNIITTGVYPDALPFQAGDPRLAIQTNSTDPKIVDAFAKYDNKYRVSGSYMTGVDGAFDTNNDLEKPTNVINTRLYRVKSFDELNGNVKIVYDKNSDLLMSPDLIKQNNPVALAWANKLNGTTPFTDEDKGRLLLEYEWVMTDGRYMRDSKMLMVKEGSHDVEVEVYNAKDNSPNDHLIALDVQAFQQGDTIPTLKFDKPSQKDAIKVKHFSPSIIGFKNIYDTTTIDKIEFVVTTSDINAQETQQTIVFDNIQDGAQVNVPTRYVYSSYEEKGQYFAKIVDSIRTYTLHYDATHNYYYITMDTKFKDEATGLERFDVESDMKVKVYVSDTQLAKEGQASFVNKTFINNEEVNEAGEFTYEISGPLGYKKVFSMSSLASGNQLDFVLPIGEYTMTQTAKEKGYTLENMVIDGVEVKDTYKFEVREGGKTTVVMNNKQVKEDPKPDPGQPGDPTKPNDPSKPSTPTTKPNDPNSVGTGDSKMYLIYMLLILVSGLAIKVFNDRRLDN